MKIFYRILILFLASISIAGAQKVLFEEHFTAGMPEYIWRAGFNGSALEPFAYATDPAVMDG